MRRTKIVCTLGPATSSPETIGALVQAGMDCARLNFSHGDHASHAKSVKWIREAALAHRKSVAILADLCGPKMRIGTFVDGKIELAEGQRFVLTTADVQGTNERVSVSYEALPRDVRPGDVVFIDDGLLALRVKEAVGKDVICEVEVGGPLSGRKGLNLPGARLSTPALTDKDREDLSFAVGELEVDYIALSFVRSPDDVRHAQSFARGTPVIAKIEKPEAIEELTRICDVADGIMVARGDLGVELGFERVPLLQKRIINEVNKRNKIVITATQMLDSMIRNPRPTRAEAADVANAVIDGTDAVMLSGETAAGRYPTQAVEIMSAIITDVETGLLPDLAERARTQAIEVEEWDFPNAAARAAAFLSAVLPLKALVTFTRDGQSASLLAERRATAPIIAITSDPRVASRLALEWGVAPRLEVPPEDPEEALRIATSLLVREKWCDRGDAFALVLGWPPSAKTNTVKLHRL